MDFFSGNYTEIPKTGVLYIEHENSMLHYKLC